MCVLVMALGADALARQPAPCEQSTRGVSDAWLLVPPVTSPRWFEWYADTLDARLAISPRERPRTFHFAQSGDDEQGDGSITNPYRTLAKAQAILNENPAGDLALLFRRGDVWREPVGLTASAPSVTVADYGEGSKPIFTRFEPVTPSLWHPDPARPGVFILDESATYLPGLTKDVLWVKQDEDRGAPLARMSTPELVRLNPGSWHWDHTAGMLYLHPRPAPGGAPIDPRVAPPFEVTRPSNSGVFIRGHASRVENIVAEGWGLSRTVTATQRSGIDVGASGNDYVAVVACESYYNPSHAIAHWAYQGAGGVVTFVGCRAGLCNFNGVATETIFNTFAIGGTQSVIFDSCEAAYGTLPSSEWDYRTNRRGRGFYGHTYGFPTYLGMIVSHNCVIRGDNPVGCSDPSHLGEVLPAFGIDSVKCWFVNETFYAGPGCEGLVVAIANAARVNGRYLNVTPPPGGAGALQSWKIEGWAINCIFDIDARARTARYALSNNPGPYIFGSPKFWNCTFRLRTSVPSGLAFSLEFDLVNEPTGAELRNCVVVHEGPGECHIGLGRQHEVLDANAYYGVVQSSYNADAHAITLPHSVSPLSPPPLGSPILLSHRPAALPEAFPIGFDGTGQPRRRTDRGAIDWSAWIGDLNQDARLDVNDLYRWHEAPTDLTGDAVANDADRAWLERALRFDELHDLRGGRRPRPPDPAGIPAQTPTLPPGPP